MKQETIDKMLERESYILKKLGKRYSKTYYRMLIDFIVELDVDFSCKIGYCGEGDSSNKKETISSKIIPDPDCANWSCWFHDRLYTLVRLNYVTYQVADKIMKYSMYYDAIKGKKGFAKYKALMVARIYYRGVQLRTWWKK